MKHWSSRSKAIRYSESRRCEPRARKPRICAAISAPLRTKRDRRSSSPRNGAMRGSQASLRIGCTARERSTKCRRRARNRSRSRLRAVGKTQPQRGMRWGVRTSARGRSRTGTPTPSSRRCASSKPWVQHRPRTPFAAGCAREGVRAVPRGFRPSTQSNPHELTARELEVLVLLCEGLKNAQIAQRLSRSVRTVDHHLAAAFAKLGVSTRTEAVAAALRSGIAERPGHVPAPK